MKPLSWEKLTSRDDMMLDAIYTAIEHESVQRVLNVLVNVLAQIVVRTGTATQVVEALGLTIKTMQAEFQS